MNFHMQNGIFDGDNGLKAENTYEKKGAPRAFFVDSDKLKLSRTAPKSDLYRDLFGFLESFSRRPQQIALAFKASHNLGIS